MFCFGTSIGIILLMLRELNVEIQVNVIVSDSLHKAVQGNS